jgi:hypothetical protein
VVRIRTDILIQPDQPGPNSSPQSNLGVVLKCGGAQGSRASVNTGRIDAGNMVKRGRI